MVAALVAAMLAPGTSLFAGPSLHARPLPEGHSFFVTNFGYDYRVTKPLTTSYTYLAYDSSTYTSYSQPSGRHMISSEIGIMHNLNPKYAVGFSNYLTWDIDNSLHGGLSLRGRRWLNQERSVDLTAGALLWGTNSEEFDYPGFVGTASMNFNDWENVKLTVTAQPVRVYAGLSNPPQQTEIGAFLGYQIGGKPGFVTTSAVVLATTILAAIFAASYDGS
jgi:hypothetical protein